MTLTRPILLLASLALALPAAAQQSLPLRQSNLDASARDPGFKIELDSTSDGRWLGGGATIPRWDVEGKWIYFQFALDPKPVVAGPTDDPWWRASRDGKTVQSVDRKDAILIPTNVAYTRDGARGVYFFRNELRYWKRGAAPKLLLTRADNLNARWSPDEREIWFLSAGDLWAADPESGAVRQLTRTFTTPDAPRPNAVTSALRTQQLDLFDFVRRQRADRDTTQARQRRDAAPLPIVVPRKRDDTVNGLTMPAGGAYVSFLLTPQVQNTQTTYSDYVNDSGHVFQRTSRPKVGQTIAQTRLGIVKADPFAIPDSVKVIWADTAGFGKPVSVQSAAWNRQGTQLVADFLSLDYKDRWLVLIDPATGKQKKVLDHMHDDAWLVHYWALATPMFWLPDGINVAYTSEVGGWHHLWTADTAGTKRQLTKGEWEVRAASLSNDETRFWLETSEAHPSERHLYSLPLAGGTPVRIDQVGEGEIQPVLSPDEQVLAFRFSNPRELNDIYLAPLGTAGTGKTGAVRVTRSGTDAFYKIPWPKSDFVTFNDDQGKPVWARVYLPERQGPTRPAVMEIHGAGYAQGVHKTFAGSGAHGGSLNAAYLAQRGVTYMVLDYRASAGYGRDTRTAIYRDMGNRDIASAVAAVSFLAGKYNVDPKRVGLFGCSYGGFFTLMALFKHPGVFQAGAAQCSVTDWAHYNHPYTARILNGTPVADSAAYKTSSPIYHAAGLKDKLLLQHGLIDGNVEYQDAVRLVQRLMELGKEFEFVTYPVDQHGWQTRWAKQDSQRRLVKLWEETILRP
ncbi:MAG: S9 family peptidase [Gemmatimonadales bacterium]|nr:S9 family peptidase [Gemmatimonadales bacterium]